MKKILMMLMLSCKKATELIDKKSFTKLSFKEKVQLNLHKSLCDACNTYEKQSKKIDGILHHFLQRPNTGKDNKSENIPEIKSLKDKINSKIPSD